MTDVYVPPSGAPEVILVDVDGTLADMGKGVEGRRGPFDWHRVGEDEPIGPIVELVQDLGRTGNRIIFMSGRDEACREATEAWLVKHLYGSDDFFGVELYMRAAGDNRKDTLVKRELFDRHVAGKYAVRFVIDDRRSVVAMWRALGLTVLAVADGDF